ncbi:hypothetical protein F8S09_15435 [Deinococcus sp. SDU3-2]|uniref:Uncharacterized protein n=1 Tax=Deinococcus terrestris TaxID=2651870 RepID=A0A7X1NYD0_9DEIO|nr:hypothetical protein [Deinococcus terrestris]MPY68048.1 hypothetical protein [Deinococcus terrestris]
MKRILSVCAAVALVGAAAQQAQDSAPRMERTSDVNVVLALLKGPVDLYGEQFGSVQFQRGILTRLQQKAITVRVLTNPASAPNMKPLKALGAQVNTLPSRFTGSMVIVQGKAVILVLKGGEFAVMRGVKEIGQIQGLVEQYWRVSKYSY